MLPSSAKVALRSHTKLPQGQTEVDSPLMSIAESYDGFRLRIGSLMIFFYIRDIHNLGIKL